MGAVASHYSGTASGINNAITRVSNVFSNAIIGALAIVFFTAYLTQKVSGISLPDQSRAQVIAQAVSLGNAKVPAAVDNKNKAKVEEALKNGFIHAYVCVMRLCAALALTGALMAYLFIKTGSAQEDA